MEIKNVLNSKLKSLYNTSLNSIKLSEYRIGIKFDKEPLAVEQNNYLTKIVNVYIAYDLDAWPKVMLRNFTLKKCFFAATNTVKDIDKEKFVYGRYGIAFDGKGEWRHGNDYARNVIDFGVDNSSSSHTDNPKKYF